MSLAALNTGGSHNAFSANVSDGTGFAITVTTSGTPVAIANALFTTTGTRFRSLPLLGLA